MALKLTKDENESSEVYETIAAILDQYMDDAQVMHPFLDVLRILCQVDSNRMKLKEIDSVCENIDLTAKMNKSNVGKSFVNMFYTHAFQSSKTVESSFVNQVLLRRVGSFWLCCTRSRIFCVS